MARTTNGITATTTKRGTSKKTKIKGPTSQATRRVIEVISRVTGMMNTNKSLGALSMLCNGDGKAPP
jgi:hypothetical protein